MSWVISGVCTDAKACQLDNTDHMMLGPLQSWNIFDLYTACRLRPIHTSLRNYSTITRSSYMLEKMGSH